jgi:hypothetical protein
VSIVILNFTRPPDILGRPFDVCPLYCQHHVHLDPHRSASIISVAIHLDPALIVADLVVLILATQVRNIEGTIRSFGEAAEYLSGWNLTPAIAT